MTKHTEGENKEIFWLDSKEKIECAIKQFYVACVNTDRKPAYELENIILAVSDGSIQIKIAARDSDANIAIQQGSVPDPTALESIFVTVKKNCHICDFANVDSPVGPCLKCAQDTMSGFKLSSTLTERPGR